MKAAETISAPSEQPRAGSLWSDQSQRLVAFAWAALTALGLFWLFRNYGYDDPYITYRYAANLAAGHGFVYNDGERILSTTTPLYTLLLALIGAAGLDIPLASNAISCVSLAAGGLALWRLGQAWDAPIAGVAGLALYPLSPLLVTAIGAEMALYNALILFGFLACARGRLSWAAVLLALAALMRADAVVAAGIAGLYVLLTSWRIPWRALLIYCLVLAPWFVFAWLYFQAPLPVTLAAKQHQGQMAISRSFLAGLAALASAYLNNPGYWPMFAVGALGAIAALARWRRWLLLPAWNGAYVAGYALLGVSGYFWYYAPLAVGVVAIVGLGVAAVYSIALPRLGARWAQGIAAALIAALAVRQTATLINLHKAGDNRLAIYQAAGAWLHEQTPPEASVGTLEVGIIGYHAQRRMIDFAGLIQPEIARRLSPTTTYADSANWAFEQYHPTYVALQDQLFPQLEANPQFRDRCRVAATFHDPAYPHTLSIYRCAWQAPAG